METTRLLPRDAPLKPGRKLRFTFTIAYEVPLDENVLDYLGVETPEGDDLRLEPATLDEIEERLSDTHRSSETLWKTLHETYDRYLTEHEVTLGDLEPGDEPRFETIWEAKERERGRTDQWRSLEWLDKIPPPAPLLRLGQCLALMHTGDEDGRQAYCERRRGHAGLEHTLDPAEAARLDAGDVTVAPGSEASA